MSKKIIADIRRNQRKMFKLMDDLMADKISVVEASAATKAVDADIERLEAKVAQLKRKSKPKNKKSNKG
jgi:polyhydroxyalkanoate synthesis regulator phasin